MSPYELGCSVELDDKIIERMIEVLRLEQCVDGQVRKPAPAAPTCTDVNLRAQNMDHKKQFTIINTMLCP